MKLLIEIKNEAINAWYAILNMYDFIKSLQDAKKFPSLSTNSCSWNVIYSGKNKI